MEGVQSIQGENFSPIIASEYQIPDSPVFISIVQTGPFFYEYHIKEPELNQEGWNIVRSLRFHFSKIFQDKRRSHFFIKDFSRQFEIETEKLFPSLKPDTIRICKYYIYRDARGFGTIQPLVDDPFVRSINIRGPDDVVSITHSTFENIRTFLRLSENDIRILVKKLQNRSIVPVSNPIPQEIELRNGMKVYFSGQRAGTSPLIFSIEKPLPDDRDISGDNIIFSYSLYHEMIKVRIIGSLPNRFSYYISMIPLSIQERSVIEAALTYIKKKSGLQTFHEGAFRISEKEFTGFVCKIGVTQLTFIIERSIYIDNTNNIRACNDQTFRC